MSKPLGMTPMMQVIRPTPIEDRIWDAVSEAIAAGMTPERFRSEVAQAWEHELREEAKHARNVLTRGPK